MDGSHTAGVSTAVSGEHLAIFMKKFNAYTFWSQNFTLRIIIYRIFACRLKYIWIGMSVVALFILVED